MQKWMIPSNPQVYNLEKFFEDYGYVDWKQQLKFQVGDIVYIYCSTPIRKVMYKTKVIKESMPFSECTYDKDYWINSDDYESASSFPRVRLELLEEVDKEELSLEYLKNNGLNAAPQKGIKVAENLAEYMDKYFSSNDGDNHRLWVITAGLDSVKIDTFKQRNFVAIGWNFDEDLSDKNLDQIKKICRNAYPDASGIVIGNYASQIYNFINEISIGDYIISSDKYNQEYVLGRCTSHYYVSDEKDDDSYDQYKNCRDVKWVNVISWSDISKESRKKFVPKSVFEIKGDAKEEFLKFFKIEFFSSDKKRNIIYFGAPGTGKSYNLNQDKNRLLKNFKENYERVTFHPDYSYANFVGTYKPVPENKSITYKYVPGPFMRILKKAINNPSEPYLLIIEEINRANVAAVFGDVFQLLDRDENNESEYDIETSQDMRKYINEDKIKLPSNLFIWATMNSADQGVFPMDTAFKRRWDFKYFSINSGEDLIKDTKTIINDVEINWNALRKAINHELLSYKINEDKLMGPFFAFNEFMNEYIDEDTFKDIFKNKIIMYLFEDAARSRRNELFSGVGKTNVTYSQICESFDEKGIEIFTDSVKDKFIKNEDD